MKKQIKQTSLLHTAYALSFSVLLVLAGCSSSGSTASDDPVPAALPPAAPASYPETGVEIQPGDFTLSAINFVETLGAGWNLGNTLDAHVDGMTGLATQTSWGQPLTTQAMLDGIRDAGMKVVRIPVSWHNHVDAAFTIDPVWMSRVIEVVEYARAADLAVIINIHHDDKKEYYYPDPVHAARSREYVTRVWKQIALMFRHYDERVIFELLNEPRLVGHVNEWNWNNGNLDPDLAESARIIGELEQAALDVIRETGGNNAERYVMVTPYAASPWASFSSHFAIPEDTADDKLILSVHAYTPYVFAMQDPGVSAFTDAHKSEIDQFMGQLHTTFTVAKNMPVIIGEYGATNKNNLADRVAWFSYYCGKAASYGMSTILWDNGNHVVPSSGKFSELYGFYNRTAQTWYFPEILEAIIGAYE